MVSPSFCLPGSQLHSGLSLYVVEFPTRISTFLMGRSSQHRVVIRTCFTACTVRRSTVHQGDFSCLVSVHFLPSCTMVGTPSTAFLASPSPASLLATAGLYLATLVAQSGRSPGQSPPHVARSSPNNS